MNNPDLILSNIDYLVRSAAWFWKYGKSSDGTDRLDINKLADTGNITKITLWTHGGTSTVGKRVDKYGDLQTIFSLSECNFHMNNLAIGTYIDYHIKPDTIEKYIPKDIEEDNIFHYRYFYYDENNIQQKLCAVIGFHAQKWGEVTKQNKSNDREWVKGESGSYYYKKIRGEKAKLVRIPNELQIQNLFGYSSSGTERYCINPDAFSILLAAMVDTRYTDHHFNGCVQTCGKGHPSKSHKNGYNIDMRYLWKDKRKQKINITNQAHWTEFDLYRHSVFMSKLSKRGYNDFLVEPCDPNKEKAFRENKLDGDDYTYKFNISPHKDHVHIQGIFFTKIIQK